MIDDPHDSWNERDIFIWQFKRYLTQDVKIITKDIESLIPRFARSGIVIMRRDPLAYIVATGHESFIPRGDRRFMAIDHIQMIGRSQRNPITTTIVNDEFSDLKLDERRKNKKNKTPERFQQEHPKRFKK